MATWPVVTGDIVTSTIWNGLPVYELSTKSGTTYTLASGDQYQKLLVLLAHRLKLLAFQQMLLMHFQMEQRLLFCRLVLE